MVSIKRKIISNIKNISQGERIPCKIIVLESDDWGSNRIASKEDYNALIKAGVLTDNCSVYNRCDTISREEDFNILFEMLSHYKGADGKHPAISAFMNPANPDFDKIKENGFSNYYYETFLDTLQKTGEKEQVFNKWNEGIENHLIYPEYHGREHLTVPIWMEALRKDDNKVKKAFEYHFYSVDSSSAPSLASGFRPTLYFSDNTQKEWLKKSLADGLDIMQSIFGFTPISFAPSNGISHPEFDEVLFKKGVVALHNSKRFEPDGNGGGNTAKYGRVNQLGQTFYNRNCVFEPVHSSFDAVDFCMAQIQGAFNWHKAAIISTHRVNYMGSIDPQNRDSGIKALNRLLKSIVSKWPDVRFMTTDEYVSLIRHEEQ